MTPHELDLYVLARTIWGEARGEPVIGQVAVANVIRNRVEAGRWYSAGPGTYMGHAIPPGSTAAVCLHPWQFSVWNEPDGERLWHTDPGPLQKRIAAQTLAHRYPDMLEGATHYYAPRGVRVAPDWSLGRKPVVEIGGHKFYAGVA